MSLDISLFVINLNKKMIEVTDLAKNTANRMMSEEGKDIPYEERKSWDYFWIVDPLDGTKEFIKKNG